VLSGRRMDSLINDVRYALRQLSRSPGSSGIALLTLALALGANTAIYSVVDALMLRPLPYRDPARLMELAGLTRDGVSDAYFTAREYLDWQKSAGAFEQLEAYTNRAATIAGVGEPETIVGGALTGGMMRMLGVGPRLGRTLDDSDAHAGRDDVVVLSESLWRRRFGADPQIIGRAITLDDRRVTVVGVMPQVFNFPYGQRQFWVPLTLDHAPAAMRVSIVGRVRPDVPMTEAQAHMDVVSAALVNRHLHPDGWRIRLEGLTAMHLNPPVRRALYVLSAAVLLVLLIACANVANLLLLQGAARGREVAVRAALGASRARIARQALTEMVLLAFFGGLAGLLLAQWTVDLLAAFTPAEMTFLSINAIALNGRVLIFAVGLTLVTGLLFGAVPAVRRSTQSTLTTLTQGSRTATGGPRQDRLRQIFVFAQLALSLMLLVGAGLLVRTFVHVTHHDVGFDPRGLISAQISLPKNRYPTPEARAAFDRDLLARVSAVPGVLRASVQGGAPPIGGGISFALKIATEREGLVIDDPRLLLPFNTVGPDFFDVMRIPLRRGRSFNSADTAASPKVVILSESFARRVWKDGDPIGQRMRLDVDEPWLTVVGVVGDVYQFRPEDVRDEYCVYYPLTQDRYPSGYRMLVIRAAADPSSVMSSIKRAVWSVDALQPIAHLQTLDDAYAEFLALPRFYAWLMGTFALIGLSIACAGLYGVLAYATAQRTREFGIRIALGASNADVLRLVMSSAAAVCGAGIAGGLAGSIAMTRALQALLVDVSRTDVPTYGVVTIILATIALAATWVPARAAALTDPAVTLRCD